MANNDSNSLQIENENQDQESSELIPEEDWREGKENLDSSSKKKQALNDKKRGEVRRNIEEIKERRRLKELLSDDYDDLDYLDS